jgi:hypothetical protein
MKHYYYHHIISNTFAFGEEGVEAQDELVIAAKQIFHSFDHSGSVNAIDRYIDEIDRDR